jgi:hypothetical protein
MRQAIFLDGADLTALRQGQPLTIQIGGIDLLVMLTPRAPNGVIAESQEAPNGASPRRRFTDAARRKLLQGYDDAARPKTTYLQKHRLSTSMITNWRRRTGVVGKAGKAHA